MRPLVLGPYTGFNPTTPKRNLPAGGLSFVDAVRVVDGSLEMFPGWVLGLNGSSQFAAPVIHMQRHEGTDGSEYLCIHTKQKFYVWNGTTLAELTNTVADYSSATDLWSACSFGDLYIFSNGIDDVQAWDSSTPTTEAADLANAPKAFVYRSFGSYVLAAEIVDAGDDASGKLVKWCASGDPTNWTTLDSGSLYIYEAEGPIVDVQPLTRDSIAVYKSDSVHTLQFVGYPFYFVNVSMNFSTGVSARRAVAQFNNTHICLTDGGLQIWDGGSFTPFGEEVANIIAPFLRGPHANRNIVFHSPTTREIWVCLAVESGALKTVLVYNTRDKNWTVLGQLNLNTVVAAGVTSETRTWDDMNVTWDSQTNVLWGAQVAGVTQMVYLSDNTYVYRMDRLSPVFTRNGASYAARFETGVYNPAAALFELPFNKAELVMIDIGLESGTLNLFIGVSETGVGSSDIVWHGPFTPDGDGKVYTTLVGRFFMFRGESTGQFKLSQITPYFVPRGVL